MNLFSDTQLSKKKKKMQIKNYKETFPEAGDRYNVCVTFIWPVKMSKKLHLESAASELLNFDP